MTRPRNPFNNPPHGTPNGVPIIGAGVQEVPGQIHTINHWLADPVTLQLPGAVQTPVGPVQGIIQHVFGGTSKRLRIATELLAQMVADVPHTLDEEAACRKALDLADSLLMMDHEDVQEAIRIAREEAKAQGQSEGGEAGSSEQ